MLKGMTRGTPPGENMEATDDQKAIRSRVRDMMRFQVDIIRHSDANDLIGRMYLQMLLHQYYRLFDRSVAV